jgi:hypothetical protein
MTGGARMPKPELAYTIFVGLPVTGITVLFAAVNWAVEQGVVWNAGRPDRKQVRANDRAARRTPQARVPDAGVG